MNEALSGIYIGYVKDILRCHGTVGRVESGGDGRTSRDFLDNVTVARRYGTHHKSFSRYRAGRRCDNFVMASHVSRGYSLLYERLCHTTSH